MGTDNMFFISHSSDDNEQAKALYDLLLEINPEWEGKIFLDCSDKRPLDKHTEWPKGLATEVSKSRYLIYVTRSVEHIKEGYGWVYKEVSKFQDLQANRNSHGRSHKNISYIGIFLCPCHFELDLFSDPERGDEYHTLYYQPDHLVLGEGATIEGAKTRIREKIIAMVEGGEDQDTFLEILDGVKKFRDQKISRSGMMSEEAIDDALLPPISCEKGWLSFQELDELILKSNVQLIGNEGGSGKTTLMTKLFHHYLRRCEEDPRHNPVPLYIDAKSLAAQNELILRYLALHVYEEYTAMTAEQTSYNVSKLSGAFAQKRKEPRYLLLIDGYNELPESSVKKLAKELKEEYLPGERYESVRLVIAGRTAATDLPEGVFTQVTVKPLSPKTINDYLREKADRWVRNSDRTLLKILSVPMYLKLFANTTGNSRIQTKTDLLCEFLDFQQKKDTDSAAREDERAMCRILMRHVLPAVAYKMMTGGDSSFVLTEDGLIKILDDVIERLKGNAYRIYYGSDYRQWLKLAGISGMDGVDLFDAFTNYFVETCKLLHKDSNGEMEFVHQIYRDFFCAWYIAEDIRLHLKKAECCTALSDGLLDSNVMEFVCDLLQEKHPTFDRQAKRWDYSCNDTSCLVKLLPLCREDKDRGNAICVANIMNMLRHARRKDLSGLDLSDLDLTAANLQSCTLSRYDGENRHLTTFAGARINKENLFVEDHYDNLLAACTNEQYIACLDEGGFLKLWEKKISPRFPVMIITNVRYHARRMLFHPDGKRIYAMTAHEILEIPVKEGKAEPKVIFRTTARLREIAFDDENELLFTTNTNTFNFKKISDPEAPDRIDFYGINSAAAVNGVGDRLAFGFITGQENLRLFDVFEDGKWQERKFGYGRILEEYILALEDLFKRLKLYHRFPTDSTYLERRSFFVRLQNNSMKSFGSFENSPGIIADKCKEALKEASVELFPNQLKQLDKLVSQYTQYVTFGLGESGLLMHLNGRRVTGLSFHRDQKTLLISCNIDYCEKLQHQKDKEIDTKKRYDNMVLTLDTDTLRPRMIRHHKGENYNTAFYCGDDIVVMTRYQVNVFDKNGAEIAMLRPSSHLFRSFLHVPSKDTFYVFSNQHIYEMTRDLRCVRSIYNEIGNTYLIYFQDESGEEYLCLRSKKGPPALPGHAIHLRSGASVYYDGAYKNLIGAYSSINMGDMRFALLNNQLVSFQDDRKKDEMSIHHRLYISGCDFTNVQGTITEPAYLQTLYRMGGMTDPCEIPKVHTVASCEPFSPSDAEFILPENLPASPYRFCDGMTLQDQCNFSNAEERVGLYVQKTWAQIQKDSWASIGLKDTDYSILEWVNRLQFATPTMIHNLVAAGLIADPHRYRDAGKRLTGPLHKTYKFVTRLQFFVNDAPIRPLIATIHSPFGTRLLRYITNQAPKNPLEIPWTSDGKPRKICISDPQKIREYREKLALNSWFTITAKRHKDHIKGYSLYDKFKTSGHASGGAKIDGYLRLEGQAFFGQAVRSGAVDDELVNKVMRLCILATYYRTLVRTNQPLIDLERQPIVVLICEDLEQCMELNEKVQQVYPHIRKLYTFDSLVDSEEAAAGAGNYFEFQGNVPHSVKLEDLIR